MMANLIMIKWKVMEFLKILMMISNSFFDYICYEGQFKNNCKAGTGFEKYFNGER